MQAHNGAEEPMDDATLPANATAFAQRCIADLPDTDIGDLARLLAVNLLARRDFARERYRCSMRAHPGLEDAFLDAGLDLILDALDLERALAAGWRPTHVIARVEPVEVSGQYARFPSGLRRPVADLPVLERLRGRHQVAAAWRCLWEQRARARQARASSVSRPSWADQALPSAP